MKQEMMGWQRHQLDHMQIICTLLTTDNHTITSPLSFYRPDALLATQPTASKYWRQNWTLQLYRWSLPMTHFCTTATTHLMAICPGLPGWAGTRKVKTNLDFTEAKSSEWQWYQLGHMQICTSLQTDNHTSTPPLSFLQAGCLSFHETNSVKALKAMLL